jgi:hypothetical protein
MDIVLFVLIDWLLAKLLLVSPLLLPAFVFLVLRRLGLGIKFALVLATAPVLLLLAWVLYGLNELNAHCENSTIVRSTSEKLGPIDTLFVVDGPGWWMDTRFDIERHSYRNRRGEDVFHRIAAKKENTKPNDGRGQLLETELRSQYRVTVEQPRESSLAQHYLTTASVTISDRATGKPLASVQETAWGGGLIGSYLAAALANNPFATFPRYLSCGYAGKEIGVFRDRREPRSDLYRLADEQLIDQLFTVN